MYIKHNDIAVLQNKDEYTHTSKTEQSYQWLDGGCMLSKQQ